MPLSSLNRRSVMVGLASAVSVGQLARSTPLLAAELEVDADAQMRIWLKLVSDLSGRTCWYVTRGDVWGFKPQADDLTIESFSKRIFGYWTLGARKATVRPDGAIELKARACNFYLDPDSQEITETLLNPYTGERVGSRPLSGPESSNLYDQGRRVERSGAAPRGYPVETGPSRGFQNMRIKRQGDYVFVGTSNVTRLRPPNISWWKLESDMTSFACPAAAFDDADATHIPSNWSQNLVAEWLTWMKMHGTPGHVLFKGEGSVLRSSDQIPSPLRVAVERRYPDLVPSVLAWR